MQRLRSSDFGTLLVSFGPVQLQILCAVLLFGDVFSKYVLWSGQRESPGFVASVSNVAA